MEQIGSAIIGKLSNGQLFIIIVAVVIAAIFYIPRIRWNKGRPYIFDPKYADQRADMKKIITEIEDYRKNTAAEFEKINKQLKGMSVEMLKCNIYTPNMEFMDQICSAVRYIKSGYNSETKKYIEKNFIKKHPKEWKICWDLIKDPNA